MKSWRPWDRRSEPEKFKDATGYEECPDFDPAEVREALQNPDKSHIDEMISVAEQAEREYVAQGGTDSRGQLFHLPAETRG